MQTVWLSRCFSSSPRPTLPAAREARGWGRRLRRSAVGARQPGIRRSAVRSRARNGATRREDATIMSRVAALPVAPRPVASADNFSGGHTGHVDRAFRGFVMFLMLAGAMRLWTLRTAYPASDTWAIVGYITNHVPWQGCSLHDLIQPAFSFLVGAALPFSIASRRARGATFQSLLVHAIWRGVALMLPGIFLRSLERPQRTGRSRIRRPERPRLHIPVPAGVRIGARPGRSLHRDSGGLLARVGGVSAAGA